MVAKALKLVFHLFVQMKICLIKAKSIFLLFPYWQKLKALWTNISKIMDTWYYFPFCGKSVYTYILYFAGTLQGFTNYTLQYETPLLKTKYLEVVCSSTLNFHKSPKFHNEKQEAF